MKIKNVTFSKNDKDGVRIFLLMNIEYFLGFGIKLETLALLQPL